MKNSYLFSVLILSVASYAEAKKACELQKGVEPVKQQLHPQNKEVFCPIMNFENTFSYGQQKTGKSEWLLDSVNTYSFSSESDSIDYLQK